MHLFDVDAGVVRRDVESSRFARVVCSWVAVCRLGQTSRLLWDQGSPASMNLQAFRVPDWHSERRLPQERGVFV
jgi:hypothetical protein